MQSLEIDKIKNDVENQNIEISFVKKLLDQKLPNNRHGDSDREDF